MILRNTDMVHLEQFTQTERQQNSIKFTILKWLSRKENHLFSWITNELEGIEVVNRNSRSICVCVVVESTPVLLVDVRTIEQCRHHTLMETHASKNQTDPVQRRQQKENQHQKETGVVGLSHTAVDPNTKTKWPTRHRTETWRFTYTYQLHRIRTTQRARSTHCLHYTYVYMKNKIFHRTQKTWLTRQGTQNHFWTLEG